MAEDHIAERKCPYPGPRRAAVRVSIFDQANLSPTRSRDGTRTCIQREGQLIPRLRRRCIRSPVGSRYLNSDPLRPTLYLVSGHESHHVVFLIYGGLSRRCFPFCDCHSLNCDLPANVNLKPRHGEYGDLAGCLNGRMIYGMRMPWRPQVSKTDRRLEIDRRSRICLLRLMRSKSQPLPLAERYNPTIAPSPELSIRVSAVRSKVIRPWSGIRLLTSRYKKSEFSITKVPQHCTTIASSNVKICKLRPEVEMVAGSDMKLLSSRAKIFKGTVSVLVLSRPTKIDPAVSACKVCAVITCWARCWRTSAGRGRQFLRAEHSYRTNQTQEQGG